MLDDDYYGSPTAKAAATAADTLIESVIESGHIGNRLVEEINALRSELLQIKQEKRLLIVANRNLQEENNKWMKLAQSNYKTISAEQDEILNQKAEIANLSERLHTLDLKVQSSNKVNKEMSEKLRAERTKLRMIGFELEKSLEDELILKKQYSSLEYEYKLSKDLLHDQEKHLLELRTQQSKIRTDHQFKFSIVESLTEISKAVELALSSKQGQNGKKKHHLRPSDEEVFDPDAFTSAGLDDRIQQLLLGLRRCAKSRAQLRKLLTVVKSYDDLLLSYAQTSSSSTTTVQPTSGRRSESRSPSRRQGGTVSVT
eukprot:gene29303-38377_t